MLISNTEWKLCIYSNMSHHQMQRVQLDNIFSELTNICKNVSQNSVQAKGCDTFISQGKITLANINTHDRVLVQLLGFTENRVKRGLLNAVGAISKQLFGTLDDSDTTHYNDLFNELREDQQTTNDVVAFYTTIIDNLIQEFNVSSAYMGSIEQNVATLHHSLNKLEEEMFAQELRQEINVLLMETFEIFTLCANQYKFSQSHLFDILEAARHGHLHPYVISPDELLGELNRIQKHFDSTMNWRLPLVVSNTNSSLKLISLNIYTINNQVVYLLKVPIVTKNTFSIFQVTSVPRCTLSNLISVIVPATEMLVVSDDKQYYFNINKADLTQCSKMSSQDFVCTASHAFNIAHTKGTCEFELFTSPHHIPLICCPRIMSTNQTFFLELASANSWIFVASQNEHAQVICRNSSSFVELKGIGVISIYGGCTLRAKNILLTTHATFLTKTTLAFQSDLQDLPMPQFDLKTLFNSSSHETHLTQITASYLKPNKVRD